MRKWLLCFDPTTKQCWRISRASDQTGLHYKRVEIPVAQCVGSLLPFICLDQYYEYDQSNGTATLAHQLERKQLQMNLFQFFEDGKRQLHRIFGIDEKNVPDYVPCKGSCTLAIEDTSSEEDITACMVEGECCSEDSDEPPPPLRSSSGSGNDQNQPANPTGTLSRGQSDDDTEEASSTDSEFDTFKHLSLHAVREAAKELLPGKVVIAELLSATDASASSSSNVQSSDGPSHVTLGNVEVEETDAKARMRRFD